MFVLFGLALIAFNYLESSRITLLGADDLVQRIAAHMRTSIAELYQPAQGFVDVSSKLIDASAAAPTNRSRSLDAFSQALRQHPSISAIFVGTETGDFFLVRSLDGRPAVIARLEAPSKSRFAVQIIERHERLTSTTELLFYDDSLQLLESRPLQAADFDPRNRDWYREAIGGVGQITTDFYVFFTTGEVGVTFARRLTGGAGVLGADLSLDDLSAGLSRQRVTPSTRIVLLDGEGRAFAVSTRSDAGSSLPVSEEDAVDLPTLDELGDPVFEGLAARIESADGPARFELEAAGRSWLSSLSRLPARGGEEILLAISIPRDELLANVHRVRNNSILMSAVLLVVAVGSVLWVSRGVSGSLRRLAGEAEQIRRFRLATPMSTRSRIIEVDELAATMSVMKSTLQQFFEISRALSAEKDQRRLLEMILREAVKVSHADGGTILMESEDQAKLEVAILENDRTGVHCGGTSGVQPPFPPIQLEVTDGGTDRPSVDRETALRRDTILIDDLARDQDFDTSSIHERFDADGYRGESLLSVPLTDQKGDIVGLMQLVNARTATGEVAGFDREIVPFIEALAGDAAVALDLRRLLKAQKDLLESFIHVVAGAIDAKSPYTHGHCERVPEAASLLATAAHESDAGPFAEFSLSEDEWYELHIASWLHDCGKVTTPEYVVDKATRLETLTDRIHEIRTRFELLWRDAEIEFYRSLAEGATDTDRLRSDLERRLEEIRADFEFVAQCNLGETFMDEQRIDRLRRIASETWLRHLDDRIGLSHEELARKQRSPAPELPVLETLLADRAEHIIEREGDGAFFGENPHGFRMQVPEHLYNRGELYNLSTPRGTLTAEERFKINEHSIQTLNMLGRLPFPRELRRVPDWAGNHHEKLDGTGYPRGLGADELSIPERVMAIADIFEALTAADRPYTRPKTLSAAIRIMASMRDDGHLCPELFELFLSSGVYRQYGERFLAPEQLDEVDIGKYT
jgi:HD-GYP domain-containing protein (c-di-GMP phosphodiesterase class II)